VRLCIGRKLVETEDTEKQSGIFPGSSLPLLLFCTSYIYLTEQLKKLNTRYDGHTIKTSTTVDLHDNLNMIGKIKARTPKKMDTNVVRIRFTRVISARFCFNGLQNLHQFSSIPIIFGLTRSGTDDPWPHLSSVRG